MKHSKQRGANLVEAAFVLPILLLLWFGIIELGRGYQIYQTMTNAAREGARLSVAPPPGGGSVLIDSATVKTAVCAQLNAGGVPCKVGDTGLATVSVCQACPGGGSADCTVACNPSYLGTFNGATVTYTQVDVSVDYHFQYAPIGAPLTIKAQAVMRNENN
jgi:Flp pilus assembly protein TadG